MSFALRSATRALPRAAVNTTTRAFSSTVVYQKTATQTVKDGVKSVDQAVSSKIVDGIDAAENAAEKAKRASQDALGNKSAAGKAEELKGQAKGAAEEAKGKAKGAAEDIKKSL
ncbi:hypothetical protein LMH87_005453 [Akanthomyces muscarius]|uniref:LEA domain protein n=1 Tax=Akanthomyces muscarius TaxID=2231603 RepID=A0A9W8QMJ6_AKAMU|nr:hypothetical protein LMH87_005453 [Akanthomyces muscarius]KAJ4163745.1 hypothetical protein LMH87_005453 [Akanthomyces muscarius]